MVISGLRYREIYPQKELSWILSVQDIPTTGDTNFKFCFSGSNNSLFEIFSIRNKKIYSNNNELLGGYISNSIINFSGEINNNYYSLNQDGKSLLIGSNVPNYFTGNLIKGFAIESIQSNFLNFKSLQILGERPQYFVDYPENFEYSELNIPINFFNLGDFPLTIYSGKVSDSAFQLSIDNNLIIPASGNGSFTLINKNFLEGFRKVPIVLYSEIGTLDFSLNLSGFRIDESTYYLTIGPKVYNIQNNTSENYLLSFYNVNTTNLVIELKHLSGVTGDYRAPKSVINNLNSGDLVYSNISNLPDEIQNLRVSGYITGSGFLSSPISGIVSYYNSINNQSESGIGYGEAQDYIFASPQNDIPLELNQILQVSGTNNNLGFSAIYTKNNIFLGAPTDSELLYNNGAVNIFNRKDDFNGYKLSQKINNPNTGSDQNYFGFSLSNSLENRLFIGSPFESSGNIPYGSVWLYIKSGLETGFSFKQKISYDNSNFYSFNPSGYCFGYSIANSLSGDKLFIGAINDSYLYLSSNKQDHGSISIYTTPLNSIKSGFFNDYVLSQKITGESNFFSNDLKNFGEYIYTNKKGDLLFTNSYNELTNLIHIFKEENDNWILKQTISTLNPYNRYFYVNNDATILAAYGTNPYTNKFNTISIYKNIDNSWQFTQEIDQYNNANSKFVINDDESVFILGSGNLQQLNILTGNYEKYSLTTFIENKNNDFDMPLNGSLFASHDATTIGVKSGAYFNLYNYYPPGFASLIYELTLTGVGDAELFTSIPAKTFVSGLEYEGTVTFLGGYLTGYFSGIGTGYRKDDYYGWEYDNQGILRKSTTLNDDSLNTLCKYRPELSICNNRVSFDVGRSIVTGYISGIDTKFIEYTGTIYADYGPEDLTTINLQSPVTAITGRFTGLFDIYGFALAIGTPSYISGKILGDFAQFFEPGSWTITKPWAGYVSGEEFLNLLDEEAFDPRTLEIKKLPTTGFIVTGLRKDITFKDFCAEDLLKFPGVFEISGVPEFVRQVPQPNQIFDTRFYRFGKDAFAVAPILSGVEWQYENSNFQLQSGFLFIFSGFPVGGRTRISRLGYTLSGEGEFNNLFQLPYAPYKKDGKYLGAHLSKKEQVGEFDDYKIHKTDLNGNLLFKQRLDFLGNPEFKKRKKCKIIRDEDGYPRFDGYGYPITVPVTPIKLVDSFTEDGSPILNADGNAIQTYDCEPELDPNGNVITEYFHQNESAIYTGLSLNLDNNFYDNFTSLRMDRDELFSISFSGFVKNANLYWESAFEEDGQWKPFSLHDVSGITNSGYFITPENEIELLNNNMLTGKLLFGHNYLRIKYEIINKALGSKFPYLNFSGVKKSLVPIVIPDYYEIANEEYFAGWEESLQTVDTVLYNTGIPPCLEVIRASTFFFDPCDSTFLKINVVKPTYYKSGDATDRGCFLECFNKWPRQDSINIYTGFFSGYMSNFIKRVPDPAMLTPLRFGITSEESCYSSVILRQYRNNLCGLNIQCPLYRDKYLNPSYDGYYTELTSHILGSTVKWYEVLSGIIKATGACLPQSSSSSSDPACQGQRFQITKSHFGDCGFVPVVTYTNNENYPITINVSGQIDDDILFNGVIYESGKYPFWKDGCGRLGPFNGGHYITPYNGVILPGDSFQIDIQSYGGAIGGDLCVSTGIFGSSSSSSSSSSLTTEIKSMWINVE
jgi:hypothetical protein